MHSFWKAFALWIVIFVVGGTIFVWSGIYNIAADDHHLATTIPIINTLRDRSIAMRDGDEHVPNLDDPALIGEGATQYAQHCAGCHRAPSMPDLNAQRRGMYPQPPLLAKIDVDNPQEAFWYIKHGIKMTAMPAWGLTFDDHKIWSLVAFVSRKLPKLSAAQYKQITQITAGAQGDAGNGRPAAAATVTR